MRAWARLGFSRAAETARDPPALLLHPACAYMMWFPKRKEERERETERRVRETRCRYWVSCKRARGLE